ncbi:hypothetical protein HDU91_002640, partial [Kappamyces sp. JEL0680]
MRQMPEFSRRIAILCISAVAMCSSGSFATFSLLSDSFQSKFKLSFSDVNMISAVMNSSLYVTYLFIGPLYDRFGVRATQLVSTVAYSLGYLLIYLSYLGMPTNAILMALYYFIGGFGSCGVYMAMVGANAVNFPEEYTGLVMGFLLLFYGLSGVIYSQIYASLYTGDITGFLFFILLSVVVINIVSTIYVQQLPWSKPGLVLPLEYVQPVSPGPAPDPESASGPPRPRPFLESPESSLSNLRQKSATETSALLGETSMTPKQMLVSSTFWLYALSTILQQGLTYMVNISAIIQASYGQGTSASQVAAQTALHVTVLSASQSAGRFVFGAGSDWVAKRRWDRSILLVV